MKVLYQGTWYRHTFAGRHAESMQFPMHYFHGYEWNSQQSAVSSAY